MPAENPDPRSPEPDPVGGSSRSDAKAALPTGKAAQQADTPEDLDTIDGDLEANSSTNEFSTWSLDPIEPTDAPVSGGQVEGSAPPTAGEGASDSDPGQRGIPADAATTLGVCGNYELLRRIGRGGMGDVFLARHRSFQQRRYAIKLIRKRNTSQHARARFQHEIQAMGDLVHPNLVFASDAHVDGKSMYLVMEYVPGSDLQQRLDRDGPFAIGHAAEILRQVATGLAHAHARNVIHRDVKPSNIIAAPSGVVKLLDLGIACLQNDSARVTVEGTVLGTASFLPPELWQDARHADARSDLYSLGCTAYSLITGKPPFNQDGRRSMAELLTAHQRESPLPLEQLCPDVPPGLSDLISRSLSKDPNDRIATAAEFAELISPYCEPLPRSEEEHSATEAAEEVVTATSGKSLSPQSTFDSSERWTRNLSQPQPMVSRIVMVTACLLTVSTAALALAYFGRFSTAAWQLRFDQLGNPQTTRGTGFLIEWLRASLYITLTVWILGTQFTREVRTFFDPRQWSRSVTLMRLSILTVVGLFVWLEGTRQLSVERAPAELARWGNAAGLVTSPDKEAAPYRPYLVYSLINYIVVMGGLFAFPLIRFWFSDLRYILRQLDQFRDRQERQTDGRRLTGNLHRFGTELRGLTGRYLSILGALAIGAHFDYWVGSKTLTEEGQNTMILGMVVACSAALFVITIALIFFRGFDFTSQRIASYGSIDDERELSQVDTVWFLRTTLLYSLGGLTCISLLVLLAHALLI